MDEERQRWMVIGQEGRIMLKPPGRILILSGQMERRKENMEGGRRGGKKGGTHFYI